MSNEMKDWYDGDQHELIRVAVSSGGFQVDYDPIRGMYRVSVFDELGHWQDECWFDQYERPSVPGKAVSREWLQIVFCKDCRHRGTNDCPMCSEEWYEIDEGGGYYDSDFVIHDNTIDEGFCDRGDPMEEYYDE